MGYMDRIRKKAEQAGGARHPGFAPGSVIVEATKLGSLDSKSGNGRTFVLEGTIQIIEHTETVNDDQQGVFQGKYAAGKNEIGATRANVMMPEMGGHAANYAAKRLDDLTDAAVAFVGADSDTDDVFEGIWPMDRDKASTAVGMLVRVKSVLTTKNNGDWMVSVNFEGLSPEETEVFRDAIANLTPEQRGG